MKTILMAVVMAVSAGAAYAGPAAEQLGLSEVNVQVPMPIAAKVSKEMSPYGNISGLYQLWLKNDFSDPGDRKLVEDEMHRLVGVSGNKAELIMVRVMLSNANVKAVEDADFYQRRVADKLKSLRTDPHSYTAIFVIMNNDEMTLMYLESHTDAQLGEWVAFMKQSIKECKEKMEKAAKISKALIVEISLVDARLAQLK